MYIMVQKWSHKYKFTFYPDGTRWAVARRITCKMVKIEERIALLLFEKGISKLATCPSQMSQEVDVHHLRMIRPQ